MSDSSRIRHLVERAINSGLSPENVCAQDPDLLVEVRRRLVRSRNLQSQLDEIFPPAAHQTRDTNSAPEQQAELPRVAGYELQIELGRGGVGVVYRALDLRLNRLVALKMLLAGAHASALDRARFVREARAVAALCNANIVQIHDIGESEGTPFFTMELCSGGTLADRLAGTPQPAMEAAKQVAILADAVSTAHDASIVHRDLKPANILLAADGTPKISDFGLARYIDLQDALTISGVRVGTPSYMAPEQASGRSAAIGPAVDIYALGAILYEMLTGRPPFRGESPADTERQLLTDDPVPPARLNPRVPRDLQTVCLKCLAKDPSQRYSTVAALADDLRRFERGEPVVARPIGRLARTGKWIGRHPGAATALLAICIALGVVLSGLLWLLSSRAATIAAVEQDLHDAVLCQQRSDWVRARADVERATIRLGARGPAELRSRLAAARRDSDVALRLDTIRLDHAVSTAGELDSAGSDKAYTAAFREAGIGDPTDDPTVVAERIRGSSIHDALVAALDDWTFCTIELPRRRWLLAVARQADSDPTGWRTRARDPATWNDNVALAKLASQLPVTDEPAAFLLAVEWQLRSHKQDTLPFLTRIQQAHPADFWVNLTLGGVHGKRQSQPDAIRYLQAAMAIRPSVSAVYNSLGVALGVDGRPDEAIAAFHRAIQLDPTSAVAHSNLGIGLAMDNKKADLDEAIRECRVAVSEEPQGEDFHGKLGFVLAMADHLPEAVVEFQNAVAIAPRDLKAQAWLRTALCDEGKFGDAAAAWRAAINADPSNYDAWYGYAEFCLYSGRIDDYRWARTALLRRFGSSSNPTILERTSRTCFLTPDIPAAELERATATIDRVVGMLPPGAQPGFRPYALFSKGLAEYRNGHMQAAIDLDEGPAASVLGPAPKLVSAMAHFKLGDTAVARQRLTTAIASYDWTPKKVMPLEGLIYHILRREAEKQILDADHGKD